VGDDGVGEVGEPEGDRVEAERSGSEHAADHHVVRRVVGDVHDIRRAHVAAIANELADDAELRLARIGMERSNCPGEPGLHRGAGDLAEDDAPDPEAGKGEAEGNSSLREGTSELADRARAEIDVALQEVRAGSPRRPS
jgi:hypothetical protein